MALNPPITHSGIPLRVDGEHFVLERKHMEIEVIIPDRKDWGKKSAKGLLYITSCRMVFVNDKYAQDQFKSFDVPLINMFQEKFEQPVFGSNYLYTKVKPLYNLIPGVAQVKLWFTSGGCDCFLRVMDDLLRQIRTNHRNNQVNQNLGYSQNSFNSQRYQAMVDPNDPSVIYISQPDGNQYNYQNQNQYYGNNQQYQQFQPMPQPQQQYQQPPNFPQQNQMPPNQFQQQPPQQMNQQFEFQQQQQPSYNYPQQSMYQGQPVQGQPAQQQFQQPIVQGVPVIMQQQQQQQQQYMQQGQQFQGNQYPPQQNQPFQQQQQVQQGQMNPAQQQGQMNQPLQQQQQQQQMQNPNAAYYFGFWGPQLKQNY